MLEVVLYLWCCYSLDGLQSHSLDMTYIHTLYKSLHTLYMTYIHTQSTSTTYTLYTHCRWGPTAQEDPPLWGGCHGGPG